jgi:predicted AlkP superfamily phosphohydrolase/phosphomutase
LLPFQHLSGACRFYLKALDPYFELYVSPINFDPMKPELPISTPPDYAAELARATGRFYTQGMPEDTKSLKTGVLTETRSAEAGLPRTRTYVVSVVLDRFDDGLLFYYFGHIDQVSHMMARHGSRHPGTAADSYRSVVENLYIEIVGSSAKRRRVFSPGISGRMSDHGFSSWRRSFSLNLLRDGYLVVRDPAATVDTGLFTNVDWTRTRAYALGLNGLYINVRGREAHGIVDAAERVTLADEIARSLNDTIDPKDGGHPVRRVFRREDVFHVAGHEDIAPDLIVGYAKGTRSSDDSALGKVPRDVLTDNTDAWSGDHCMDPDVVPGILLTSRPLRQEAPSLDRLASALLAEFGISNFPEIREGT